MDKKVLVIGGGASGLTAAIFAARAGARVTILEYNNQLGKKILVTGNGKCNLSNTVEQVDGWRSSQPELAKNIIKNFPVQKTIAFFTGLGVYTKNKSGWLYPYSEQASAVLDSLLMEARSLKITCKTNQKVERIQPTEDGFQVSTDSWTYTCDQVILACGSCASRVEGSSNTGYKLAKSLGHTIIEPKPALVPLKAKGNQFAKWAGVRVDGAVTLVLNGQEVKTEAGQLQLTDYGVSGIPAFQLSRYAVRALDEGCQVTLYLDFMQDFSKEMLLDFLKRRKEKAPYKSNSQLLISLLPEKLMDVLITEKMSMEEMVDSMKSYPLEITGSLSFAYAQVASGGVNLTEIQTDTMESTKVPGLYFCGELLDVDGACGGFNLQWAWSTGALAGMAAAGEKGL